MERRISGNHESQKGINEMAWVMETHGWLSVPERDRLRTEIRYEELNGRVKWARLQGRAFKFALSGRQ